MEGQPVAACYIRVSTDDQTEYSPDSQLKLLQDYAKSHGLLLPEEYVFREEEGVSGRKADRRPEFQRMIGTAKSKDHPFSVILVWKFSRFARNQEESIVYKSMLLKECGVQVVSISEPTVEGPFGGLIERIIEWMDEYYSIRLSGEVLRGMREAVSRGHPVNGTPFGYLRQEKRLVPDPDAAPVVRQIFQWYMEGWGCRKIAGTLNDRGIRTKRGNPLENRTIEYILRNPVYIGRLRWGEDGWIHRDFDNPNIQVYDGRHESIVSMDIWNAVQEKLLENKARWGHKARTAAKRDYFLRGILRCSNCGGALTLSGGGVQCSNYNRSACTVSHFITIEKAQDMILSALQEDFLPDGLSVQFNLRPKALPPVKDPVDQQLKQEQRRLQRIQDAYEAGVDTLEEYRANKAKISARIQELTAQKNEAALLKVPAAAFSRKACSALAAILSCDTPIEQKNAILRSFVDHITFDRAACTFTVFYYL